MQYDLCLYWPYNTSYISSCYKDERSTTTAGRKVIAAAIRGAGASEEISRLADACEKERNWRFRYQTHFMNMVKVSAQRCDKVYIYY